MIKYIKGNLVELALAGEFDVIIHGANCNCNMGKGIAKQIAIAFPEACKADKATKCGDVYKLGEYSYAHNRNLRLKIVNLYTQYEIGAHFEYSAFCLGLRSLIEMLTGDEHIGLPMIGAGLAGGDWEQIETIIKTELMGWKVTIVKYDY